MRPDPPGEKPRFTVRLKECPVCLHPWNLHDERGACRQKDCWCLYNPPEENVELE